jgi:hypothetical protein
MNFIERYFARKYTMEYLKKFLDMLPLDGKKRIIGLLIVLVSELAKMFGTADNSFLFDTILNTLKQSDYVTVSSGVAFFIVGALHYVLKRMYPVKGINESTKPTN